MEASNALLKTAVNPVGRCNISWQPSVHKTCFPCCYWFQTLKQSPQRSAGKHKQHPVVSPALPTSQFQILWMRTISNKIQFWILHLAQIWPPVWISDITVLGFRFHCKTASHLADSISETATFYAETRWESTHLRQGNKPKSKRKRIENYRVRCLRSTMKTREDSMKGFRSMIYFNERVLLVTGHQKI